MAENEEGDYLAREASRGNQISNDKIYTTQLAQIFLCGSSSWALNRISYETYPFGFGTFTFLLGHGLLGLLKYTMNENTKNKLRPLHKYSSFLTRVLPLPLMTTQIYISYNQPKLISYSHLASIIIPTGAYLFKQNLANPLIALAVLANVGSLAYISMVNDNYWTLGLSALALWNEFAIDYIVEIFESIPPVDIWTAALGIFVLSAINALESV